MFTIFRMTVAMFLVGFCALLVGRQEYATVQLARPLQQGGVEVQADLTELVGNWDGKHRELLSIEVEYTYRDIPGKLCGRYRVIDVTSLPPAEAEAALAQMERSRKLPVRYLPEQSWTSLPSLEVRVSQTYRWKTMLVQIGVTALLALVLDWLVFRRIARSRARAGDRASASARAETATRQHLPRGQADIGRVGMSRAVPSANPAPENNRRHVIIRSLVALVLGGGFLFLNYALETTAVETARALRTHGTPVLASLTEARITTRHTVYHIPIGTDGHISFSFELPDGRQINASSEIDPDVLRTMSTDGTNFQTGRKFSVLYLPEDPEVALPVSEVAAHQVFNYRGFAGKFVVAILLAFGIDLRFLRRRFPVSRPSGAEVSGFPSRRAAAWTLRPPAVETAAVRHPAPQPALRPAPSPSAANRRRTSFGQRV
nr:hypothetical protein [uncultured Gellertiella sp.]